VDFKSIVKAQRQDKETEPRESKSLQKLPMSAVRNKIQALGRCNHQDALAKAVSANDQLPSSDVTPARTKTGRAPGCAKLSPAFDFNAIVALVLAPGPGGSRSRRGPRTTGVADIRNSPEPATFRMHSQRHRNALRHGGQRRFLGRNCPVGSVFRPVPFGFNPASSPERESH
jgi:hypothetical protein